MNNNSNKLIAIIGRPNVGKSTLFNRLLKERKSIVDDTPGVTRDRLYADIKWGGKTITIVDTGGLEIDSKDETFKEVKRQVLYALDEADFILFLVDGKDGITSLDEKIASHLRKVKDKKKIFLGVNKIDTEKQLDLVYEFYSLGFGEPYPVSAISGSSGLADILDEVSKSSSNKVKEDTEVIRVAIVGKPNVGKSSILNALLGKERAVVTSIPGTTRDSIDTHIRVKDKDFVLIDTAGLRRKSKILTHLERYSTNRAILAIEKADIVLLVVDATEHISDQDQKIASVIKNRNKASIILINKCDLVETPQWDVSTIDELHFVNYSKILITSAVTKKNINNIWDLVNEAYSNYEKRISTGKLNKAVEDIVLLTSPPTGRTGRKLRIYYVTQSNVKPPEIVFFVNDIKLVKKQYEKFLEKELRKRFDFSGTPIKMVFRNKREN